MPTYQYRCTECGESLEVVQSFSEDALTVCPQCSGALRKVFNSVGVVFKGSGFYRTDSRAGKSSSATTAAGPASSDKPAAKSGTSSSSSDSGSGSTAASTSTSSSASTPASSD